MIDFFLYKLKEKLGLEDNQQKADKIVENATMLAMGVSFIPLPFLDMVAVTAVQIDMIRKIAELYKVEFTDTNLKSWLSTLSGSVLSKLGAEAVKQIPVVGSIIGGFSMAALSGASTYATGQVFIRHFEEGGNLSDFDAEKFKNYYAEQFERGKLIAKSLQDDIEKKAKALYNEYIGKEKPENPPSGAAKEDKTDATHAHQSEKPHQEHEIPKTDPFERLKQLVKLRDQGVITQAEFVLLKTEIINKI